MEVYHLVVDAMIAAPVVGLLPLTPFMRGVNLATETLDQLRSRLQSSHSNQTVDPGTPPT